MFTVYENQALKGRTSCNSDPVLLSLMPISVLLRISIRRGGLGHRNLETCSVETKKDERKREKAERKKIGERATVLPCHDFDKQIMLVHSFHLQSCGD